MMGTYQSSRRKSAVGRLQRDLATELSLCTEWLARFLYEIWFGTERYVMNKNVLALQSLLAASIVTVTCSLAKAQEFKVCKSTFALCTIASCEPIAGSDKQVACHCTVNQGYSAGQEPCQGVKDTPDGQQIRSRYYPVHSYAVCSNGRPWAWCLDKPCLIDKNNPQAALCTCDTVKNLGDYVIVTTNYTPSTCTAGIISSATIQQITQVTDYLKSKSKTLLPFEIQVLNQ
jgi:hypothetical protein